MAERGRPSIRTDEIDQKIIDGLSAGTPLTVICREDGMPETRTVYDWREADPEFSARFARARDDGFDQIALDALAIADETERDTIRTEHGDKPNNEWISRSKLRVETRLKLLAKWDPKRYGDMVKVGNADGSNIAPEVDEATKMTRLAAIVAAIQTGKSDEPADDAS